MRPDVPLLHPRRVAVITGDTAFHEQAHLSGGALALELIAAAVAAAGLLTLATSPTVLAIYQQTQTRSRAAGRP